MGFGSKIAWGIDIGESAVRAVKLKVQGSGAQVLAVDVVPRVARADGYSYTDKNEQIRDCLSQLAARNGFGSARVALAAPGAGFDRFITLPAVSMKQVPQIVKYEARQQIPFPLEEVAWDYQFASSRPIPGEGIEVALFAIKTQIIEQMLANLSVVKLGVDVIGMSRLALYNVLKFDRQVTDGTIIIDVGAGSTDIVICTEDNFRVRSIPISGEAVTKMLQQKFGISYEEAEELKKKASQSKQPEKLFNVMRPTFERLLGEINKTIGYYKQQFKTLKIDRAYLVGESFRMQPLVDMFVESLGCEVRVLTSFQQIVADPAAVSAEYAGNMSSFAVAIGLALQAAGAGPVTINLLPDESQLEREVARKKPFAVGTAACIGFAVLAAYFAAMRDSTGLNSFNTRYAPDRVISGARQIKEDFERTKQEAKTIEEDNIQGIAGLGYDRDLMVRIMNEMVDLFGERSADGSAASSEAATVNDIFVDEIRVEPVEKMDELTGTVTRYTELTLKGWTANEDELEHIYNNIISKLNQVDIFTAFHSPNASQRPRVHTWERKLEGDQQRIVFEIRATVTPRPPADNEDETQWDQ